MEDLEMSEQEQQRLVGFTELSFGGCEALGDDCSFMLQPDRTVLVGHNGCGKSLLLESLMAAAAEALGARSFTGPTRFSACVRTHDEDVSYRYEYTERTDENKTEFVRGEGPGILWQEVGSIHGLWDWKVKNGVLSTPYNDPLSIPDDIGILQTDLGGYKYASSMARFAMFEFANRLSRLVLKRAKFPRISDDRGPVFIEQPQNRRGRMARAEKRSHTDSYLHQLGEKIIEASLSEAARDGGGPPHTNSLTEIAAIGRRIGAWQGLVMQEFHNKLGIHSQTVRTLEIDTINYGYASDGTLRMLDLLADLIIGPPNTTILIDEPELGIHPGMLARLLAELEAHSVEKQIIIATHSPQVVSWARPEQLRIVERVDSRTQVREVTESQAARIARFLQQDGSLGDFTYGGGFDE